MFSSQWQSQAVHGLELDITLKAFSSRKGFVYLVAGGLFVKIGYATDPHKRLGDLQVGNPEPLRLLGLIEGTPQLERELHERFAGAQYGGEWFRDDLDIIAYFRDHGALCKCTRRGMRPTCRVHGVWDED